MKNPNQVRLEIVYGGLHDVQTSPGPEQPAAPSARSSCKRLPKSEAVTRRLKQATRFAPGRKGCGGEK